MIRDIHIKTKDIPGLTIKCPGGVSLKKYNILIKNGSELLPELISGSNIGTILESNPDVAEVKINPTIANWYVFLKKNDWIDSVPSLVKCNNLSWDEAYAMAKTFTGKLVSYKFLVTRDSFCETSFQCFPKVMDNILKAGYLDCILQWESLNCISIEATLEYPDHCSDYDPNIKVFYWTGFLDRNGFLKGKLQIHQSETETY